MAGEAEACSRPVHLLDVVRRADERCRQRQTSAKENPFGLALDDGDVLFRAGDAADAGYVIQHGSLKLLPPDADGSDAGVICGPGVLIGEIALLTETVRPVTAIAREPTMVMRISRSLFRKVLEGFPDAARLMRDRLAERANQAADEISAVRGALDQGARGR